MAYGMDETFGRMPSARLRLLGTLADKRLTAVLEMDLLGVDSSDSAD